MTLLERCWVMVSFNKVENKSGDTAHMEYRKLEVLIENRWVKKRSFFDMEVGSIFRLFEPGGPVVSGSPYIVEELPYIDEYGIEGVICTPYKETSNGPK